MKNTFPFLFATATLLMTVATADAQQTSDPRVSELTGAGTLRVALFLPQYIKDAKTGQIRGHTTGTVTVPIAQALATRLGVTVQLIGYPTPALVMECLKASACDIAFMGVNPSRAAQIAFSPPLILLPYTYLVPPGSSIRNVEEVDRPGMRIAVVRYHESTTALNGILKHAKMIDADIPDAAFKLLRKGEADAFASPHAALLDYLDKLPGSRVLDDYYGANLLAIAVPKGYAARLSYMTDFTEEVKASGLLQRTIDSASQRGIRVAPPANATAQK